MSTGAKRSAMSPGSVGGVVATDVHGGQALPGRDETDHLAADRLDLVARTGAVTVARRTPVTVSVRPPGRSSSMRPPVRPIPWPPRRDAVRHWVVVRVRGTSASRARPEVSRLSACSSVARGEHHVDGSEVGGVDGGGGGLGQDHGGRLVVAGEHRKVGSVKEARPPYSKRSGRSAEHADRGGVDAAEGADTEGRPHG